MCVYVPPYLDIVRQSEKLLWFCAGRISGVCCREIHNGSRQGGGIRTKEASDVWEFCSVTCLKSAKKLARLCIMTLI